MFKVGQEVYCAIFGKGVVIEIVESQGEYYPVSVKFNGDFLGIYTVDGKYDIQGNTTLFHYPVKIVQDEPVCNLRSDDMFKVGQKVICKKHGEGVVTSTDEDGTYPIDVKFISGEWDCYTEGGKLYEDDDEPSLSAIEE